MKPIISGGGLVILPSLCKLASRRTRDAVGVNRARNPAILQSGLGGMSLRWIDFKQATEEGKEELVPGAKPLLQICDFGENDLDQFRVRVLA